MCVWWAGTVRVGDALTNSRKSRADFGGAMAKDEVLKGYLVVGGTETDGVEDGRLMRGEIVVVVVVQG